MEGDDSEEEIRDGKEKENTIDEELTLAQEIAESND